jgi:undecaprenyl pyrophosphate phosphatase UppP
MLILDSIALFTICVVCILRLNDRKHRFPVTVLWAFSIAGTFGIACEQIAANRIFGPDSFVIMMHIGLAGLLVLRFARLKPNEPERRETADRRLAL